MKKRKNKALVGYWILLIALVGLLLLLNGVAMKTIAVNVISLLIIVVIVVILHKTGALDETENKDKD